MPTGGDPQVGEDQSVDWWARNQGWVLYPLAVVTYVAFGIAFKPALNWIVGPLWVLLIVWLLPAGIVRLLRGRR